MNEAQVKELVKKTVCKSITDFLANSLKKQPKFQILDLLIPRERKIRSVVGGLETSLGTTLWEPLARNLAEQNGFVVHQKKLLAPENMPGNLSGILHHIIEDRKTGGGAYTAASSHETIRHACQAFLKRPITAFENAPKGRGVDIWLEKDGVHYFFDIKTVQPNLSALIGCMEQVLYWYACFYARYPAGQAFARIVFPYNPNPEKSFWDGVMGKGKPLEAGEEGWVGGEFWDFCSGLNNTGEIIQDAFTEIRASGELQQVLNQLLDNHD